MYINISLCNILTYPYHTVLPFNSNSLLHSDYIYGYRMSISIPCLWIQKHRLEVTSVSISVLRDQWLNDMSTDPMTIWTFFFGWHCDNCDNCDRKKERRFSWVGWCRHPFGDSKCCRFFNRCIRTSIALLWIVVWTFDFHGLPWFKKRFVRSFYCCKNSNQPSFGVSECFQLLIFPF